MTTIFKVPQYFSTVNNPVVFSFSGDSEDLLLFKVEIEEVTTGAILFAPNATPKPTTPNMASFDVSKIIASLTRFDIDNNDYSLLAMPTTPKPHHVVGFRFKVTEYGIGDDGNLEQLSDTVTAEIPSGSVDNTTYQITDRTIFYGFEGNFDMGFNKSFKDTSYALFTGNTIADGINGKFLTLRPNMIRKVDNTSFEQLSFLRGFNTHVSYPYAYAGDNPINSFKDAFKVRVDYTTTFQPEGTQSIVITNESKSGVTTASKYSSAFITITGTSSIGDNIGVSADTRNVGGSVWKLGSFTASSSSDTTTQIATNLANAIASNPYGFNVTHTGNTIEIKTTASTPVLTSGDSGNYPTLRLTDGIIQTGTTGTSITVTGITTGYTTGLTYTSQTATDAVAYLDISILPSSMGLTVDVYVDDCSFGLGSIATFTSSAGDTSSSASFGAHIVSTINGNGNGYTASNGDNPVMISTSRHTMGCDMNGKQLYYIISSVGDPEPRGETSFDGYQPFASGYSTTYTLTAGTSSTTVTISGSTFNKIKTSINQFAGGTNPVTSYLVLSGEPLARLYNIQVSPKQLVKYVPELHYMQYGNSYSITILDWNDNPISETRHYLYEKLICAEKVNVIFSNSLSGVECIQMIAPQQTITSKKLTIQPNSLNYDNDNANTTDGVGYSLYNATEKTYSNVASSKITLVTQDLDDYEADLLAELIKSENIWFETSLGNLLPVQLTSTTYKPQHGRYLTSTNQPSFDFELPDNYLPSIGESIIQ